MVVAAFNSFHKFSQSDWTVKLKTQIDGMVFNKGVIDVKVDNFVVTNTNLKRFPVFKLKPSNVSL